MLHPPTTRTRRRNVCLPERMGGALSVDTMAQHVADTGFPERCLAAVSPRGIRSSTFSCRFSVSGQAFSKIPSHCRPCAVNDAPCRQAQLTTQDHWRGGSLVGNSSVFCAHIDGWPSLACTKGRGTVVCKSFTARMRGEPAWRSSESNPSRRSHAAASDKVLISEPNVRISQRACSRCQQRRRFRAFPGSP